MAESVKVAVRVRPFNQREKDRKSGCCIAMDGKNTTITDPESGEARTFTFDHSYWSHDKESANFATQDTVFKDLGQDVLENAWQGYNASLFAYGQTGSGKSFSMVGWGDERGIIPRVMEAMFERIGANKDTSTTFRVQASMLEIYNERVRDLFNPRLDKQGAGLKVRENPKTGPYVEDLSLNLVNSYAHIDALMEEGNKARTIGATNMNNTSSRAHTIFQITFTQTIVNRLLGRATDRVSRINLVDLAGSERADDTGAKGDRLKEACSINKSLSALGNCISALADQSSGKKKVFIPYRDSVLTWLLKESLGGNAKTIMIAAISPADINFEESLSTLRYADRAKQIKNKPTVNEDANQKMIAELKQEIERLRSQLTGGGAGPVKEVVKEVVVKDAEQERQLQAMRDQLLESEKLISELSMTYEEQLRKTQDVARQRQEVLKEAGIVQRDEAGVAIKTDVPRLVNLNEDAQLDGCLVYFLKPGITRVGKKDAKVPQQVVLAGLNVASEHCIFENTGAGVFLEPVEGKRIYLNGKLVKQREKITTGDRIILGTNHVFRFVNPDEAAKKKVARRASTAEGGAPESLEADDGVVDWAFAQRELAAAQGTLMTLGVDPAKAEAEKKEMEAKVKDMLEAQQKMAEEKAAAEKRMEDQKREAQKKMDELARMKAQRERMLQEQLKKEGKIQEMNAKMAELAKQVEAERAAAQAKLEEQARMMEEQQRLFEERQRELERSIAEKRAAADQLQQSAQKESMHISVLEERLFRLIPLVNEMNMVAEQMDKPVHFDIKLIAAVKGNAAAQDVKVRVTNLETAVSTLWDHDKFMNRVYLIREEFLTFQEGPEYHAPPPESDPFIDVIDEVPIGTAEVYLQSLFYLIDIDDTVPIVDYKGKHEGDLTIEIKFADERGQAREVKAPSFSDAFLGKRLDLLVRVKSARGIPLNASRGVFVRFKFAGREFRTEEAEKTTTAPEWVGASHVTVERVASDFVKWISTEALGFEVLGHVNALIQSTGTATRRGSVFPGGDMHSRRRASDVHTLRPNRHAHIGDMEGEKSGRSGRSGGVGASRAHLDVGSTKSIKGLDVSPDRAADRRRSVSEKLGALEQMKEMSARLVEMEAVLQEQRMLVTAAPRPDAELTRMVDEHGRQADRLAVEETQRRAAWTAAKTRLMSEPAVAELEGRHAEAQKQLEQAAGRLKEVEMTAGSQKAVLAELQKLTKERKERGEPDDPALAAKAKEAAGAQRKAEMERAMAKENEKQLAAAVAAAAQALAARRAAEAELGRLQGEVELCEAKRIAATSVSAVAQRVIAQNGAAQASVRTGFENVLKKFEGMLAMQREQAARLEAVFAATSEEGRAALKKAASAGSPQAARLEADLARARAEIAEKDAEIAKLRSKSMQAASLQDMQARLKEEEVKISERERLHERLVIENALRIAGKKFEFKSPTVGGDRRIAPATSAPSGAGAGADAGADADGMKGSKACVIQ
eukprot:tig00020848_g14604.t1